MDTTLRKDVDHKAGRNSGPAIKWIETVAAATVVRDSGGSMLPLR
jgi:hypothetical protein